MKLILVPLIGLTASLACADALYNASLGTLPQAQGFTYSGDNGNPAPFVSGGLLHETATAGAQYWTISSSSTIDFSQSAAIEASVLVNSSNHVYLGDGTPREGYYFYIQDKNGGEYSIGLASTGFSINSIEAFSSPPLTPYPIAGAFHSYLLTINHDVGDFYIDGTLVLGNIAPALIPEPFAT